MWWWYPHGNIWNDNGISYCLRFDNKLTRGIIKKTDNLAAIKEIFEKFVQNYQFPDTPSKFLIIDEKLEAKLHLDNTFPISQVWHKSKCASRFEDFYVYNLKRYPGKQPDGPFALNNKVDRLFQSISGSDRNITFDKWIT